MYSTYMLPNNHKDLNVCLEQLCQAIKLVYASIYFKDAKSYIDSTSAKIEEEKMAVIIQELIGTDYNGRFYPTFSGVAQSYNFYPVSHQKREDGVVNLAVGLGYSVVGGEKVLRFSPKYPEIIPDMSNPASIFKNTQRELYVLDTTKSKLSLSEKEKSNIKKINVSDIAKDGTLEFTASTYDKDDGMIRDSFVEGGPHLVTFANILKYNAFPIVQILSDLMEAGHKSMGSPVEIEFSVNIDPKGVKPPVFAIIQIRPFIVSQEHYHVTWGDEDALGENVLIYSNKALGNGTIETIQDIVYVPPDSFDSADTFKIAEEIGVINKQLSNSQYVLIGPGRWGTQDRWLGIPVQWNEISNVKLLVETSLKDFNIKPSQGTHFFQNIISRGIGYANITLNPRDSKIDWGWLNNLKAKKQLKHVKHIHLSKPLVIKLDGRTGRALVIKPE